MLLHYFRISFRNMWKYKSQALISVTGLAVGFTCFALAMLWIRYEMTFDSFHKNAKQMYVVYKPDTFSPIGHSRHTVYPLAAYLKETFPEVADAMPLTPAYSGEKVIVEDIEVPALTIRADSSLFRMFDVKILVGNRDFLIPNSKSVAITQEKAWQLFGSEDPIGKIVNLNWGDLTICAVVSGMSKRSCYAFDFIMPFGAYIMNLNGYWNIAGGENTIIELATGTNIEIFKKKLYEHNTGDGRGNIGEMTIIPITKLRYSDSDVPRDVKFQHILIFALSGLLVVLCSLLNYLTLFISRFRERQKELALRVVCGASEGSLPTMLSVEFILTLLFAVLLGFTLTQWLHKPFLVLSDIQMDLSAIYREVLVYVGGVIIVSLLIFWLILLIFRRRSLNLSIRRSNKNLFRKTSVVVQLLISIGFAFCTVVILKQIHFLHHTTELGFSFQNRGAINLRTEGQGSVLANQLKQIPEITEVIDAEGMLNLIPLTGRVSQGVDSWDDKPADAGNINLEQIFVSPEYISFYNLQLLAGEILTNSDPDSLVLLNESAVKAFGWHDPVGKHFTSYSEYFTVKGVIKDIYNFAPTVQVKPIGYSKPRDDLRLYGGTTVLFKYGEGMWESCKEKIEQLLKKENADLESVEILNSKEEYNKFLKSENALIKLLSFVSAVCIFICVFGFVSIVALNCEERRKEIAIRKINGAISNDILSIFAKEYFLLLLIGATIAFSAGYFIVQRWLEHYMKRTAIPLWIYLSTLSVMALVIVLCVGWRVYRSSIENPAEVVKTD